MTTEQIEFKPGDRVLWRHPPICVGTVLKHAGRQVKVRWDTGEVRRDDPEKLRHLADALRALDATQAPAGDLKPGLERAIQVLEVEHRVVCDRHDRLPSEWWRGHRDALQFAIAQLRHIASPCADGSERGGEDNPGTQDDFVNTKPEHIRMLIRKHKRAAELAASGTPSPRAIRDEALQEAEDIVQPTLEALLKEDSTEGRYPTISHAGSRVRRAIRDLRVGPASGTPAQGDGVKEILSILDDLYDRGLFYGGYFGRLGDAVRTYRAARSAAQAEGGA